MLQARPDGASTAQPCSRAVEDAIHGLGKAGTKSHRARCSENTCVDIQGLACNTIVLPLSARNTGGGAFPKDSAFPKVRMRGQDYGRCHAGSPEHRSALVTDLRETMTAGPAAAPSLGKPWTKSCAQFG